MKITVIGAGIWGSMTALALQKGGNEVTLVDMWGPGNPQSGSGGHTRMIRLTYGEDKIYTDLTNRSFRLWDQLAKAGNKKVYHETGVLWLYEHSDETYLTNSRPHIEEMGHKLLDLDRADAQRRYPQVSLAQVQKAYYEEKAGMLLAGGSCKLVVEQFVNIGGHYLLGKAQVNEGKIGTNGFLTINDTDHQTDKYIFACGPWNRKLFPQFLSELTYTSRQEVYFFGVPNDRVTRYSSPELVPWFTFDLTGQLYYGFPALEGNGMKIAYDNRDDPFDPDSDDRYPTPDRLAATRAFLYRQFPELDKAPLLDCRVCQYENSRDGHFIIDHYPGMKNLLIMGGSSGHGFKMAPAIADLVCDHLMNGTALPGLFSHQRLKKQVKKMSQFGKQ